MSSPTVSTRYASGSSNTVRPKSRTYPNGRTVTYDYGAADGINDRLSRIEAIVDDDSTVLAEYQYLGLGAVVQQDSPEADLRSTLVSLTGANDPDTGDIYSGLDRFGRVTDVRWRDVSASSDLSRVQYGYDRASNRTFRKNPSDTSSHHDWAYGYDGLHRLKHADRGTLASPPTGVTDPQFAQCWTLDASGNWAGFRQANTGNPWSLVQARTASPVNEITGITNSVGAVWAQPAYDAAGNMTAIPQPADPTGAYTATYDAWNRLVKLTDGVNTVQENVYDARGYRIVRKSYTDGTLTETRHYYYTNGWRCVEERLGTDPDSAAPERQHVWGVRYIDDLVVRDRDTNNNGTLDERLYACQDGNWNTTAVVATDGTVQERYEYDPYGDLSVLAPNFSPRTASSFDWNITYAGYRFDIGTGLYQVRFRFLHSKLGWVMRDPIGYEDSTSLVEYAQSTPSSLIDSYGLQIGRGGVGPSMPYYPPVPRADATRGRLREWKDATDTLAELLKKACVNCRKCLECTGSECNADADRIADGIHSSLVANYTVFVFPRWGKVDHRYGGYLCWDWAYAFEHDVNNPSSKGCFKAEVEGAYQTSGRKDQHFWIKITPVCGGSPVYVDDSWGNGKFVHTAIPMPEGEDWFYSPTLDDGIPRDTTSFPSMRTLGCPIRRSGGRGLF